MLKKIAFYQNIKTIKSQLAATPKYLHNAINPYTNITVKAAVYLFRNNIAVVLCCDLMTRWMKYNSIKCVIINVIRGCCDQTYAFNNEASLIQKHFKKNEIYSSQKNFKVSGPVYRVTTFYYCELQYLFINTFTKNSDKTNKMAIIYTKKNNFFLKLPI